MRTAACQMPAIAPWSLHTHLPLAALATAPACARGHVRTVAREWGLAELADTAELLASELVTNAVQATGRLKARADQPAVPVVQLWLTSDGSSLVIHVWDASNDMPVRRHGAPDEERGRGLLLVEQLGKDWGSYRKDGGKVVWVMLSADP
jgi:anti-sigma regulatory factor (Ser/Thr protein kinase)